METLIIRLDSPASKTKVRKALKLFQGVTGISDKLTISDIESLADDKLVKQMKSSRKSGQGDKIKVLEYLNKNS